MLGMSGAVVYGTITVGALLAAESTVRESYADTVVAVVLAILVYWLAHAYSDFVEHRLEHNRPLSLNGLARTLARELTIVIGAAIPLLALLICWVAGVRLANAVTVAVWTSAAMIVMVEIVAGVRAELSARALVVQTAVGTVFGLLVLALRLVLH